MGEKPQSHHHSARDQTADLEARERYLESLLFEVEDDQSAENGRGVDHVADHADVSCQRVVGAEPVHRTGEAHHHPEQNPGGEGGRCLLDPGTSNVVERGSDEQKKSGENGEGVHELSPVSPSEGDATIHDQDVTGCEARGIARQQYDRLRDVFGLTRDAQRRLLNELGVQARVGEHRLGHARVHETARNRIDANVVRTELSCRAARQREKSGLACAIRALPGGGLHSSDARDVHDRPVGSTVNQMSRDEASEADGPHQVALPHLFPDLIFEINVAVRFVNDPRVIDQKIDAPKPLYRGLDEVRAGRRIAHIARDGYGEIVRRGIRRSAIDPLRYLQDLLGRSSGENDTSSLGGKESSSRLSDATPSTRYDRNLALKGHLFLRSLGCCQSDNNTLYHKYIYLSI